MYHVFILFSRTIDTLLSGSFEPQIFGNAKYRTVFLKKYTYARYNYYSCKHLTFEFPPVWQRRRDFTSRIWSRDTHPADTTASLFTFHSPLYPLFPSIEAFSIEKNDELRVEQKSKGEFRVLVYTDISARSNYVIMKEKFRPAWNAEQQVLKCNKKKSWKKSNFSTTLTHHFRRSIIDLIDHFRPNLLLLLVVSSIVRVSKNYF